MFENNNDGYHANRLHAGPVHDTLPQRALRLSSRPSEDTAGYYL